LTSSTFEIVALIYIVLCLLSVLREEFPKRFQILLKSDDYSPEEATGLSCVLKFSYTSKYPEELPEIGVENVEHFEDGHEEELIQHLVQEVIVCFNL